MSSTPKRVRKLPKKLVKEVNEPDTVGPMIATSDSSPLLSAKPSPSQSAKPSPSQSAKPSPCKKAKKEEKGGVPEIPLPMPGVVAKPKKVAGQPVAPPPPAPVIQDMQEIMSVHLKKLSGQGKEELLHILDHNYCRPWNRHPDPNMKCRPAKYLFMKDFPKHVIRTPPVHFPVSSNLSGIGSNLSGIGSNLSGIGSNLSGIGSNLSGIGSNLSGIGSNLSGIGSNLSGIHSFKVENEVVDVESVDPVPDDPLVRECEKVINMTPISAISSGYHEKAAPNKTGWTPTMHKLWNKSIRILHSHRLSSLAMVGSLKEVVQERSLLEKTASRFRYLFAGTALWDPSLLNWIRMTLNEHVCGSYFNIYHEAIQLLRTKVPNLIEKFYPSSKKILKPDPVTSVLNSYRPKRIAQSPLFIIIPNGPSNHSGHSSGHLTSNRMKQWHGIFGSLGKVVTIPCVQKGKTRVADVLRDIKSSIHDQIRECRKKFYDHRPLILVGFGESSLIACHSSLDHPKDVSAIICLGFPLTAINGFRGDLDDPLLDISVPTLLVIGSNSSKCALDDVEDFRERINKAETGLIVVGGSNDRLILSGTKKKWDGLNQNIVDRCLADEISEFITNVNAGKNPGATSPLLPSGVAQ